jgi:hypothetical protein
MQGMVEPDRTILIVSIVGLVVIWGSVAFHKFVQDGAPVGGTAAAGVAAAPATTSPAVTAPNVQSAPAPAAQHAPARAAEAQTQGKAVTGADRR